jgi:hypothetical protein
MKFLYNFITKSFKKEIDGIGLSIFRIFYFTVFLCEIVQIFYYRHLIFDKIPYIEPSELNFAIPLVVWIFIILNLIIGNKTTFYCIINYIFTVIFISSMNSYFYHVFFIYTTINFLVIFIPISNRLSIDRILRYIKNKDLNPSKVNQFYYLIIPFITIGIVYLDSFIMKLTSSSWQQGLGLWKPASLPMLINNDLTFLLNNEYLMYIIGYFILLFEAVFVFLFFRKKWRIPFVIIGFIFHLGIIIAFPIPWFGLTLISIYLLLMPVKIWEKIYLFFKLNKLKLIIYNFIQKYFDTINYQKIIIFKNINSNFWYKIIVLYMSFQFLLLSCTLTNIILKNINQEQTFINKLAKKTYLTLQPITAKFFGISTTGVFIDHYHYDDYEHIIAITYLDKKTGKEIWLPYINKSGRPELSGIYWNKFGYRMNNRVIKPEKLKNGVKDFTAYWAYKNSINLEDAQFNIKVKKIEQPKKWEKDFLKKQMKNQWIDGGFVNWKDKKIEFNIEDIEKL